jgi:hypothetical protein
LVVGMRVLNPWVDPLGVDRLTIERATADT